MSDSLSVAEQLDEAAAIVVAAFPEAEKALGRRKAGNLGWPIQYNGDRHGYDCVGGFVCSIELHLARKSRDPFRMALILEKVLGRQILERVPEGMEAARKMIEAGDPLGRAYLEPPGGGTRRLQ